jgi:hypothetical protein
MMKRLLWWIDILPLDLVSSQNEPVPLVAFCGG